MVACAKFRSGDDVATFNDSFEHFGRCILRNLLRYEKQPFTKPADPCSDRRKMLVSSGHALWGKIEIAVRFAI